MVILNCSSSNCRCNSCSSTTFIMPVIEIDNSKIGNGVPGQHTLKLRQLYINNVRKELI